MYSDCPHRSQSQVTQFEADFYCDPSNLFLQQETNIMQSSTEIRHLPPTNITQLSGFLQGNDSWKLLMAAIKREDNPNVSKYNSSQIDLVERHANSRNKLAAEILFDEWGTSGRKPPTIGQLHDLLFELEFYRAADYIKINILKEAPQSRAEIVPARTTNDNPVQVAYSELEEACHWKDGGEIELGSGAFATVFLALIPQQWKYPVAVKRMHDHINMNNQFFTELHVLSRYRHKNLVELLGFSCNSPSNCLIYEYMSNGTLQERLACEMKSSWEDNTTETLNWQIRKRIVQDVAEGLVYLHTAYNTPLIHRDVKSANILLGTKFTAKLGDFGLVRLKEEENPNSGTSTIIGTSAYMAPESYIGEISVLLDSFSFGVVLLEILTSLPPWPNERNPRTTLDLIAHVQNLCGEGDGQGHITPLLDFKAGDWGGPTQPEAHNIYGIANKCLLSKEDRPSMQQVLQDLQAND